MGDYRPSLLNRHGGPFRLVFRAEVTPKGHRFRRRGAGRARPLQLPGGFRGLLTGGDLPCKIVLFLQ